MKEHETKLLNMINTTFMESNRQYDKDSLWLNMNREVAVQQAFELLQCEKLGTVSPDFIQHPDVEKFIKNHGNNPLKFWYFIQKNDPVTIEKKIQDDIFEYRNERKLGRGIPPDGLYSNTLIRSVYLSENLALIEIFKQNLPIPGVDVFKGDEVPTVVTEKQAAIEKYIQKLRESRELRGLRVLSLDEMTDKAVKIQRQVRSKLRHREEIRRIASREDWADEIEKTSPEKVIQDANKPYRPRCDKQLAKRIMVAAQQVRLFSTVKHLTSAKHIETIFNDSLYARRRLLELYLPFRPASLQECDIADGDGNVICCGPYDIDPQAMRRDTVEVLFDLKKISKNPSILFKQRDFGFGLDKKRSVLINKSKSIFFSHTNSVRCEKAGFSYLSLYNGQWGGVLGAAALPNYSLISYNVKNIHQILTLNFFRFLDAGDESFTSIRNEIYAELAKLSDEELLKFLENIGRQLSDTSEFNFYGAHRIDFSTVIALSSYQDGRNVSYTLNLNDLIASLEQNDINMLNEAKIHIPGAFNSYRFLDYLLSKTTSIRGRYELQLLRSQCITPSLIQSIPKPEPLVMPVEYTSARVSVEEDTHPLEGKTSVDKVPALSANDVPPDIAQQGHTVIQEQSSIILSPIKEDHSVIKEDPSGTADSVISIIGKPNTQSAEVLIGEEDVHHSVKDFNATLLDPQSNCLPSSFIIGMYATGSVLLIAGILACALLNPVVAAFVGLTLTATVVGALATVGAAGIVAGATTIISTWCGYFKPADIPRVEQPMVEALFSPQTVFV